MATTFYYTIQGSLVGESVDGTLTSYILDQIGSVVATASNSAIQNTYKFGPFGAVLSKIGSNPDPYFLWNGSNGYRTTGRAFAEIYVRQRTLSSSTSAWTSVDLYWPDERPYSLVRGMPQTATDPSGLRIQMSPDCKAEYQLGTGFCNSCFPELSDPVWNSVLSCLARKGYGNASDTTNALKTLLGKICSGGDTSSNVCMLCADQPSDVPNGLPNGCSCNAGAVTISSLPDSPLPLPPGDKNYQCPRLGPNPKQPCNALPFGANCGCNILGCGKQPGNTSPGASSPVDGCATIVHELTHCGGVGGSPSHNTQWPNRYGDYVNAVGCCICQAIRPSTAYKCRDCGTDTD